MKNARFGGNRIICLILCEGLEELIFHPISYLSAPLELLPGLKKVAFGTRVQLLRKAGFVDKSVTLPPNIEEFQVGSYFNSSIDVRTLSKLRVVTLGVNFNLPGELPDCVEELNFGEHSTRLSLYLHVSSM